jgi:hypothetical protein
MAENKEVVIQETQNSDAVSSANSDNARFSNKKTPLDEVIDTMAATVGDLTRTSARDQVVTAVKSVLVTIAAMNSADEFEVGIRVSGVLYRFSEYEATSEVGNLVVAPRVVLSDTMSAINFFNKDGFQVTGRVLTPSEFAVAIRKICSNLRTNPNFTSISRPAVEILAESNRFAVNSNQVEDRNQSHITFLKTKFDGEKTVKVKEWARCKATKLFS